MSLYCSPSVYAASSDIIEKYLVSLISRNKLLSMIAPTVVIISFWMVLEIYVAFLGARFKWCCSVWSPLSIRNSNSAWKFPERLKFCGSSSRGPLHEGYVVSSAKNYCREQGFENFAMSFELLLKKVGDLLINWDRFSCHISQKITHRNHWKVMHLTFSAGMFGKMWHGRRPQRAWSFVQVEFISLTLDSKQNTRSTKCTIEKFRLC